MCKSSTFNSWKFLLYITPTSIVKAEPTQNVSSSLQTSTQNDRTLLRKQCEMNCNLDTREYSLKFLRGKTWSYSAGVADLKTKKPMKADFRFRIGSVTKTFIATVLLQLSGENRLNLDDSIENGCLVLFKETDMMVTRLRSGKY